MNGFRPIMGIENNKRNQKIKRVNKIEKIQSMTPTGQYKEKETTHDDNGKDNKEKRKSMTPQEIFRMEQKVYSKIYQKLQPKETDKIEKNKETEEMEK